MTVCKLRLKRNTVHITPEMAQYLLRKGIIEVVPEKLGRFKPKVDDLTVWKYLREG